MLRRLLTQLGVTALLVALGTGAALADSAPASSSTNTDTNKTVVTDTTSVSVTSTHSSSTTVGAGTGSSDSNASGGGSSVVTPGSGSGSSAGSSVTTTGQSADPASVNASGISNSAGLPGIVGMPDNGSTIGPTHNDDQATKSSTSDSSSGLSQATSSKNGFVVSIARAAFISGLSPLEPVLVTALIPGVVHHAPPPPPPAPMSFLYRLHILLISTLVPVIRFMADTAPGMATSFAGLSAALVLVLAIVLLIHPTLPVNTYTARLRRSGFLGAARSDVAAAILSFATPREMSSIGAPAP